MKRNRSLMVTGCSAAVTFLLIALGCTPQGEEKRYDAASDMAPVYHAEEPPYQPQQHSYEQYDHIAENNYKDPVKEPLSTFSIDVDNASYTNVRRLLKQNTLPPADAVRIEEMINYFNYDYPQPRGEHPLSVVAEVSQCPWNRENRLVHVGIQGRSGYSETAKAGNYVFLIDVSGSMEGYNRLPLVKQSLKLLLESLGHNDRISIVTYAGNAGLVLPPTSCSEKRRIESALEELSAGGSTAGEEGIHLAYKVAKQSYIRGGNNRVILCTDGDFNVGVSSDAELVSLIEEKAKEDVYLTICGFGMGNYKDGKMEKISNAGNGNYFYIDNINEAEKVFVTEMRSNMYAIARDVKIQVEFNPSVVSSYRLIGYENRVLNKEDFNNDMKDAGEIGAGHTVTALYEIVPVNASPSVDPLKYQRNNENSRTIGGAEMMTLKLRYKPLDNDQSKLIVLPVTDMGRTLELASDDFRFSAAVAGFGMLLRNSAYKGSLTYSDILALASGAAHGKADEHRSEFMQLVRTAELLGSQALR